MGLYQNFHFFSGQYQNFQLKKNKYHFLIEKKILVSYFNRKTFHEYHFFLSIFLSFATSTQEKSKKKYISNQLQENVQMIVFLCKSKQLARHIKIYFTKNHSKKSI